MATPWDVALIPSTLRYGSLGAVVAKKLYRPGGSVDGFPDIAACQTSRPSPRRHAYHTARAQRPGGPRWRCVPWPRGPAQRLRSGTTRARADLSFRSRRLVSGREQARRKSRGWPTRARRPDRDCTLSHAWCTALLAVIRPRLLRLGLLAGRRRRALRGQGIRRRQRELI